MCRLITPINTFTAYWLSLTASDLTGPNPSDWSKASTSSPVGWDGSTTLSCSVTKNSTERNYMFTPAGVPGTSGATGDYHLFLRIATGDSNIRVSFQLHRVNSSGTVQSSSSTTAEQTPTSSAMMQFSLTGVNLGTWNAGDRLRVDIIVRNTATSGSAKTITLDLGRRDLVNGSGHELAFNSSDAPSVLSSVVT